LNSKIDKFVNAGSGVLIQGVLWLLFWIGPAFPLFSLDPRWGHNFALPITFVAVGSASHSRKISCHLVAVLSSFLTVPVELTFLPWPAATFIAATLLAILIVLHLVERTRQTELLNPGPRLKAWLKIHLLSLAYIGLAHMPLIFFLVRWFNPGPFTTFLPIEHEPSTSIFNLMLLIFTPLALMEKYVKQIGWVRISKVSFTWAMLMIVLPLLSIAILGK